MKHKSLVPLVVTLILLLVLVGCRTADVETPAEDATPIEVTESFYNWYFDYIGEPGDGEGRRNPLVDGAYRDSPYLTAAYVAEVDSILNSFEGGGYDPFLQAQDIPQGYTFEEDFTADAEACVIFHQQWSGSPARDLTIDLVKEGRAWKINNIRPGNPRTPEGVVQLFYDWYIGYARTMGNPLVDGAYKSSPFLSQDFIAEVEETLAGFVGGGYDPILLAQDIPVSFIVEKPVISDGQAAVVVQRYWGGNPTPTPMTVHLEADGDYWLIVDVTAEEPAGEPPAIANPAAVYCEEQGFTSQIVTYDDGSQSGVCILDDGTVCDEWAFFHGECPAAESATSDPVAVVQSFYDWYLTYIGDRSDGEFRNPLVDKAYRESPLLTEEFVAKVDALLESMEGGGYDPFLQAQDIPNDIYAQSVMITGSRARVTVVRVWGPPQMDAIFAHLRLVDGEWLIDDVTPVALYEATTETPEGTVQMFYTWYVDALRRRFEDDSVTADFHDSDLLTESFKEHLDDMEAAALAEYPDIGLGYDPLLCAQDVPYHVTPDQAFIVGETAALTVRTSFPNQVIAIDLQETDEGWRISNVTCANTPEGAAKAFYTWYLGYIGDRGEDDFRNPLADRAYRGHPLLTESLIAEVDGMFDADGGIGHDPFLLAQDVPGNFSVDPGTAANTAVVHLQFGTETVKHLLLTFTEGYRPQIISIQEATPPAGEEPAAAADGELAAYDYSGWQTEASETYGFSFQYPAGWVLEAMELGGPGMPDDWPVTAGFHLMPPDIAEQLAAQSGPPDPNAPIIVAPFSIEVVEGDEAQLARVFRPLAEGEAMTINHYMVTVFTNDPSFKQYVFQHPERPEVWVVVTDWVTGFPGREAQAAAVADVLMPLLYGITFEE